MRITWVAEVLGGTVEQDYRAAESCDNAIGHIQQYCEEVGLPQPPAVS